MTVLDCANKVKFDSRNGVSNQLTRISHGKARNMDREDKTGRRREGLRIRGFFDLEHVKTSITGWVSSKKGKVSGSPVY